LRVDAVIIGGGVTGLGIARDLAQRGLRVALFERRDIASGTTGRSHGLLHSGARYVVRDPVSASECAKENRVLRRIAPHVIEETGGMFVAVEEDDLDYERKFLEGCKRASVRVEELSVRESRKIEPYLNPSAYTVFLVDDAVVDPFRLAIANFLAAKEHNAEIYTYEPVRLIVHEGTVVGVETVNTKQKIYSDVVINATGPWADFICRQAGLEIGVKPNKGTLVVTGKRVVNTVLNRLRPPSDGDIIVPHQTTMILGTTSTYIKDPDEVMPTIEEVNLILRECGKMLPCLRELRVIRAFSGARPLLEGTSGREAGRTFTVVDHEKQGVEGLVTVTGGKLTTYRLMAERTSDLVCRKLGVRATCRTSKEELPKIPVRTCKERYEASLLEAKWEKEVVCECELVTRREVEESFKVLGAKTLEDIKRRTRAGMGECQGQFCAYKVADIMVELGTSFHDALRSLNEFLRNQWKTEQILEGTQRAQLEFFKAMYKLVGGLE